MRLIPLSKKMKSILALKSISLNYNPSIQKSLSIKIEHYLLELYALKKYKTSYITSKEKVNADIRKISKENDTQIVKEIKALIILEFVSAKYKNSIKHL